MGKPKKLKNEVTLKDEKLHKWARLISAESEEERRMVEKDPYIEEALKELEKLRSDPEKRREYEAREKAIRDYVAFMSAAREDGWEEGRQEGKEEGKEEGREEGREEQLRMTVYNMLKRQMSYEMIADITGADVAYVTKIAEQDINKENK